MCVYMPQPPEGAIFDLSRESRSDLADPDGLVKAATAYHDIWASSETGENEIPTCAKSLKRGTP